MLRDADELLLPAVKEAIAALDAVTDADAAIIRLAERYAATIDDSGRHCTGCNDPECRRPGRTWAMRWIAPLLHDALQSLGATPLARGKTKEGPAPDASPNRLAQLRAAHRGAS